MRYPAIVGFCGKARSGKDTAAMYLAQMYGYHHASFAGGIKAMVKTLLQYRGVDEETISRMLHSDLKEDITTHLNMTSPRHVMQTLGTEWGRMNIHPHFWVDTELDHIQSAVGDVPVVFSDVRFENEVEAIRRKGGVVIYLERNAVGLRDITGNHVSESVEYLRSFCTHVVPNNGTLSELQTKLDYLVGGAD